MSCFSLLDFVNVKSKCEKSYKFYFLPPKMAEMYSENALSDVE